MARHDLADISTCYTLTWRWESRHSRERVWRAITDPAEVSAWMGYPAEVDLRVGGRFFADFASTGEGSMDGIIVELAPEGILAYAWGMSIVRWELAPAGGGSHITFVHHGLTRSRAEGLGAGWHEFLEQLRDHLDGAAAGGHVGRSRRHRALLDSYAEHARGVLGGPAAAPGASR